MLPSRSHQEPKPSAVGDEIVDEPASEYARLERLVVAWLVGDSILLTIASLSKNGRGKTHATHLEMLTWPICMSMCCLYFFGTLDSSAVGRRAVGIWAGFWAHQAVFVIGKDAFFRLGATHLFQLSLIMAWLFSLGIFDVGGVDPHLAVTKMKLSLVESAALFCTAVLVLAGLAAYFLSERSQPDRRAVARLFAIAAFSIIGAYCFTARVVWVARRRRRSKVCDSDPEPPA